MKGGLAGLYLEPFDGGSHAAFGRAITHMPDIAWRQLTLPGRHWKWRMRGAGLWFAEQLEAAAEPPPDLVLASSFLPLADLVALRPELATVPKVLYFHENQWVYPVREPRERDGHFGFSQLVSAAAADLCLFNSAYNRDSFLAAAATTLQRMPDARPLATLDRLHARCEVMPFPVDYPEFPPPPATELPPGPERAAGPHLLWNHRWEHDKDPETCFGVLLELRRAGVPFRLLVCGERYANSPEIFARAEHELADRIVHWGTVDDRSAYGQLLGRAQIVMSTAEHEFFGVAVLEAVHAGARPLVPDRLAYPEHFPEEYRYRGADEFAVQLRRLCEDWTVGRIDLRADRRALTERYSAERVLPELAARLSGLVSPR